MGGIRAVAVMACLALAGCGTPPGVVMSVGSNLGDFASLQTTKKTLVDHVVSGVTGRECSTITLAETGTYCPEQVVVDRQNVYCYRTLADVNCHHIPDPYKNGHTALASPPPVRKPIEQRGWFD